LLGEKQIPADAYYGVQTARALENFKLSGVPINHYPGFVEAWAIVKLAAARANADVGAMKRERLAAIEKATAAIREGKYHDQFLVDWYQGGAGTSTNMNANEVIANLALEIAGYPKGRYDIVHPIDDVNRSQSTNDTYPTALKLAMTASLTTMLSELDQLRIAFGRKGREFSDVLKVGRTQLQDAVPMTLGQEFHGFATTLGEDIARLRETIKLLSEVNLGGTAVGTGITADPGYGASVVRHLSEITGQYLETAPDLVEATSDTGVFMTFSSALKRSAIKLSKICNDLRLLSSGPQAGLGEINLPPRQAGSSIMPGKVNPVIPEAVSQVAYAVAGADVTVTMASESGQLQLNAFEPVIAHSLLQSITWMRQACWTLRVNCVDGITANVERLDAMVASSVGVITALIPFIGYHEASKLAKQALATGRPVADLVVEAGLMTREDVMKQLQPGRLSGIVPITQAIPVADLQGEASE
jgi:aspartate ammonia-lyase